MIQSSTRWLAGIIAVALSLPSFADDHFKTGEALKSEVLANDMMHPWGMDWLDKDTLIVTERNVGGYLINVRNGKKTPLKGWPTDIKVANQGGLLDVAVSPNFAKDNTIFISFAHDNGDDEQTTRVAKGTLKDNMLSNWQVLFTATPYTDSVHHFGSRLDFDSKGHLYITVGDRGDRDRAQDLTDHAGAIHRINQDGSIPSSNPFVGKKTKDGKKIIESIYSWGHRNPQGLYIDDQDRIWSQEHGPKGGDELNQSFPGKNYGWPTITYGKEYWGPSIGEGTHKEGLEQPKYVYIPSIAPSGLIRYKGDAFNWDGDFLLGALKLRHLNRLSPKDTSKPFTKDNFVETRYLGDREERVRDVEVDAEGYIYLLTDSDEGKLVKVSPK